MNKTKKFNMVMLVLLLSTPFMFSQTETFYNCHCDLALPSDDVLLTIDGKDIMGSEFLYLYEKTNENNSCTVDEYLDLFIDFKLKVIDAEDKGFDKTEKFHEEWSTYCEQAKDSFLVDKQMLDSLIDLCYQRNCKIRRAAHIAIECPPSSSADEVAQAMMKISDARRRIVENNENFYDVALEISTDPTVNDTKGELGWIQQFRYVYPIVENVYSTPVGKVTPIFRTQYGFHIAIVEEEKSNVFVHAAHIMKISKDGEDAEKEIRKIHKQISKGGHFEKIASEKSDDTSSASREGELGWFGRGMMVPEFETVAFAMKRKGQISKPFKTKYGWHIIKFYDSKEYKSFPINEEKLQLKKQILRDTELKKMLDASFVKTIIKQCHMDSALPDSVVIKFATENLALINRQYSLLCQEYHDGILLSEISNVETLNANTKEDISRYNEKWLAKLKRRYKVTINQETLSRIKQKLSEEN